MTELPLTPREKQLLRRMAKGRSNAEIRKEMGGTSDQVLDQQFRLIRKLKVNSEAELIKAARLIRHGNEKT